MEQQLERLQILTEVVSEFKTALLMDQSPDKTGQMVLEVIQEAGDQTLTDHVLNAYLRLSDPNTAVSYLNQATQYLHQKIDEFQAL